MRTGLCRSVIMTLPRMWWLCFRMCTHYPLYCCCVVDVIMRYLAPSHSVVSYIIYNNYVLLTLGAHAQRGLQ